MDNGGRDEFNKLIDQLIEATEKLKEKYPDRPKRDSANTRATENNVAQ